MTHILFLTAALSFPLVMECWKNNALTQENLVIPNAELRIDHDFLQQQSKLFHQFPLPEIRSRMAKELQQIHDPAVAKHICGMIEKEKNPFVCDDLFQSLKRLFVKTGKNQYLPSAKWLKPYLQNESALVREAAFTLYMMTGDHNVQQILTFLQKEKIPFVLRNMTKILTKKNASLLPGKQLGEIYYISRNNPYRQAAIMELLAMQRENPDTDVILASAAKSSNPLLRAAVARGLANNLQENKLLPQLIQDTDPAVRLAAVATRDGISLSKKTIPPYHKKVILQKQFADPSPAIRAAAAESTKYYKGLDITADLVKLFADEDITVRKAACRALTLQKPSHLLRKEVVAIGNQMIPARREIAALFDNLKDISHAPDILRWLDESEDDIFTEEAITILGNLKYKKAANSMIARSSSVNPKIRTAAAVAFGKLNVAKTFPTLKKLYRDKNQDTADAAMSSMFQLKNKVFAQDFYHALKTRTLETEMIRTIACRAIAQLQLYQSTILPDLTILIEKACILIPMSPPMPDSFRVRISAMLLLKEELQRGNADAKTVFERNLNPTVAKDAEQDPTYDEFLRQLREAYSGNKVIGSPIEPMEATWTIFYNKGK